MEEKSLETTDWFKALIEDCQGILVEYGFAARWAIVEGYHELGKRISEENNNFERAQIYGKRIVHECAKSLGKSERTIYYAIQFYQKYPDLALLPEGKNTSWGVIKTKYLPELRQEDTKEEELQEIEDKQGLTTELRQSFEPTIISDKTITRRQKMIAALILGPTIFLRGKDREKLLEHTLLHGFGGFKGYSDKELKQTIKATYNQKQVEFLFYCIDFFAKDLEEIGLLLN